MGGYDYLLFSYSEADLWQYNRGELDGTTETTLTLLSINRGPPTVPESLQLWIYFFGLGCLDLPQFKGLSHNDSESVTLRFSELENQGRDSESSVSGRWVQVGIEPAL